MSFTIDPSSLGLEGLPAPEPAARPAPPVVAPTTPAVTPNAAATTPAAEPRPAAPAPAAPAPGARETIEALRQLLANFQARTAAPPAPRQESQSSGLLDALRQRVQTQMAEEDDQRIRDIGIGMLASRSPNFFSMLGEGLKAGEEGTRSRTERLRQAAESERQQRALDVEEARRQEELRLRGEDQASAVPLRAAQTRYYLNRAETDAAGLALGRAEASARNAASAAADRAVQNENIRRSRVTPVPLPPLTETEAATLRNTTYLQGLRERGFAPPAGATAPAAAAAPAVPVIEINPVARPVR